MSDKRPLVLIVDDETHILHVLSMKLTNGGFDVITAEDGEEALEEALQNKPDLIITDYHMPYLTGLDLCVKLKEYETTKTIPCIMLTARGYNIAAEHLDQTNITMVITKPFSPREVLAHVQELLGQREAKDLAG